MTYDIDPEIVSYVEREVITRYQYFDKAHRADHVEMVISQSLALAEREAEVDRDMVYLVAAFHDLGLKNGRENHHVDSRKILEADEFIKSRFSNEQIRIMGEAVEDHRASNSHRPRSIYGLIVAEADRFIDTDIIVRRTVQYGFRNNPELDRAGHFQRTLDHLNTKYGENGYLRIWLPYSANAGRLAQLRLTIANPISIRSIFNRIYDEEMSLSD